MAEPSAALAFTVVTEGEDEIDTTGVTVSVDGRDVTAECEVRVPQRWPANRADYAYEPRGGWEPGHHEAAVAWPGRMAERSWSFEVA